MRLTDLTGMKFGRLTVLRRVVIPQKTRTYWECVCECTRLHTVSASVLRTGKSKSCGCFRREMMREEGKVRNLRHGEGSNGKESPEYRTWSAMLSRCNNEKHRNYVNYGGRGITVCERWSLYENFLMDMGRRPSDRHSLDRIDNDAGYSPENCRWATYVQQNNNQRRDKKECVFKGSDLFENQGRSQTIRDWCKELGRKLETYRARRRIGMSIEEALFAPLQKPGRKTRASNTQELSS